MKIGDLIKPIEDTILVSQGKNYTWTYIKKTQGLFIVIHTSSSVWVSIFNSSGVFFLSKYNFEKFKVIG